MLLGLHNSLYRRPYPDFAEFRLCGHIPRHNINQRTSHNMEGAKHHASTYLGSNGCCTTDGMVCSENRRLQNF